MIKMYDSKQDYSTEAREYLYDMEMEITPESIELEEKNMRRADLDNWIYEFNDAISKHGTNLYLLNSIYETSLGKSENLYIVKFNSWEEFMKLNLFKECQDLSFYEDDNHNVYIKGFYLDGNIGYTISRIIGKGINLFYDNAIDIITLKNQYTKSFFNN